MFEPTFGFKYSHDFQLMAQNLLSDRLWAPLTNVAKFL